MRESLGFWLGAACALACTTVVVQNPPDGGTDSGDDDASVATDGPGGDVGTDAGTCSATTCAGCCFNKICQTGNTASACGKGGQQCAGCDNDQICKTDQTCGVDPEATWKVQPTSATIATTNQGADWDFGAGAPDPYVSLWCPSSASAATNFTAIAADTFSPKWSTGGCIMKAKDLMAAGYGIQAFDDDISADDAISGKGTIVAKEADLLAGGTDLSALPTLVTLHVAYQKQ